MNIISVSQYCPSLSLSLSETHMDTTSDYSRMTNGCCACKFRLPHVPIFPRCSVSMQNTIPQLLASLCNQNHTNIMCTWSVYSCLYIMPAYILHDDYMYTPSVAKQNGTTSRSDLDLRSGHSQIIVRLFVRSSLALTTTTLRS